MKFIKKLLLIFVTLCFTLVLFYNVYNVFSLKVLKKDLATFRGYAILEVVSGSMEPTIHVGDIILIDTSADSYNSDDIVTFYDKNGAFVTHRIVSIDDKEMITKGDNNNSKDEATSIDKIVGKYITKINGGGKILASLRNPFTMVMILIIGILIVVLISTDSNGEPIIEDKDYEEFIEYQKQSNSDTKSEPKSETNKEEKKIDNQEKHNFQKKSKSKKNKSKKKTRKRR